MFCQKRCTVMSTATKVMGIALGVVGVAAIVTFHLCQCDCLRKRTRRLACECGEAVEDATIRIVHAVDDCVKSDDEDCDED